MKWLRKLLLACVASITLLMPLAATSAVQAQHTQGHHRVYWVYYRSCTSDSWTCYGGYYRHVQAVQARNWFQANGYEAYIR